MSAETSPETGTVRWSSFELAHEHGDETFLLEGTTVMVSGAGLELELVLGVDLSPRPEVLVATVGDASATSSWRQARDPSGRLVEDTTTTLLGLRYRGTSRSLELELAVEEFLGLDPDGAVSDLRVWERHEVGRALQLLLSTLLEHPFELLHDPTMELLGSVLASWESDRDALSGSILVGFTSSGLPVRVSDEVFHQMLELDPRQSALAMELMLEELEHHALEEGLH